MTYFQSFFTDGISNPAFDSTPGAAESAFVDGSTPLWIAGPSGIGSISKAGGGDAYKDKFGVAMVPKDKSATSFVGGSDLVVFKNSTNQDAAWKFIQFMSPARYPGEVAEGRRRPAGRAERLAGPGSRRTTRSCRSSATSSRTPTRRRPCRPGPRSAPPRTPCWSRS